MTVEQANKNIIRQLIEATDRGEYDLVKTFYAPNFVEHNIRSVTQVQEGAKGVEEAFRIFGKAFKNRKHIIEDMVAENDKVAARIVFIGTFDDKLGELDPTRIEYRATGTTIYRFENGKIIEKWTHVTVSDMLGIPSEELLKKLKSDSH
jgi:predicted ester cyclase